MEVGENTNQHREDSGRGMRLQQSALQAKAAAELSFALGASRDERHLSDCVRVDVPKSNP